MLNVFTWLWTQDNVAVQYGPHHVQTLANMVKRNLTIPHRFICISDQDVPNVDTIPHLPPMERVKNKRWPITRPQCYRRLRMFDPAMADVLGERYVTMDLDTVVVGSLDAMFDRPEPLVINRAVGSWNYNGSMWLHTPGTHSSIYESFDPELAIEANKKGFVGSDQAWFRYHLGPRAVPTFGPEDGSVQYRTFRKQGDQLPDNARIVFFAGGQKPWDLDHDWIKQNYH
jgi:hypothetical protein